MGEADDARAHDETTDQEPEEIVAEKRMALTDHLIELRRRLIICIITFVVSFLIAFGALYRQLYYFIQWPLAVADRWLPEAKKVDTSLLALSPLEPILVAMKLSMIAAILFASPILLYQIWAFVRPGLKPRERRAVWPVVVAAPVSFVVGGSFGYFALLPITCYFFILSTPMPQVIPHWTVDRMSAYVLAMTAGCGAVFELPVIVTVLSAIGLVTPKLLSRIRKYVILGTFIVAGVLTPPDPFSQIILALPMLVLYEVSVLISRVVHRRRERRRREFDAEAEP